jgi:hypothetical protein
MKFFRGCLYALPWIIAFWLFVLLVIWILTR